MEQSSERFLSPSNIHPYKLCSTILSRNELNKKDAKLFERQMLSLSINGRSSFKAHCSIEKLSTLQSHLLHSNFFVLFPFSFLFILVNLYSSVSSFYFFQSLDWTFKFHIFQRDFFYQSIISRHGELYTIFFITFTVIYLKKILSIEF